MPWPNGAEAGELLGDVEAEALAADDRVDRLVVRRSPPAGIASLARCRERGSRNASSSAARDLDPGRGAVAAVADEVLGAAIERGEQVEAGDAAARAAAAALRVEGDEHDRPPEALGEARGDDPDHARMPALAGEHQPGRVGDARRAARRARASPRREDLALDLAALAVGALELDRDLLRALGILGEHQLDPGVRPVEAPGRVDPRPEPEAEVALVEPLGDDGGRGEQGPHPRPARLARLGEAAADERAVLAPQRDQVRDRRQGNQVELGLHRLAAVERGRELVGDPGGAELRERVAGDDRVQDRAVGELGARLVVVGDDHVDPGRPRRGHLGDRADPAVGGDEELGPARRQCFDRRGGQAVSVAHPVGDQPVAVGTEAAQRPNRDRGRADAVDVVVTVDGDPPPGRRRGPDPLDDRVHVREQERVVVVGGVEEGARRLRRCDSRGEPGSPRSAPRGRAPPSAREPRRSRRARG